jgi:hypothetical protein
MPLTENMTAFIEEFADRINWDNNVIVHVQQQLDYHWRPRNQYGADSLHFRKFMQMALDEGFNPKEHGEWASYYAGSIMNSRLIFSQSLNLIERLGWEVCSRCCFRVQFARRSKKN